jgi:hypothetical protein
LLKLTQPVMVSGDTRTCHIVISFGMHDVCFTTCTDILYK